MIAAQSPHVLLLDEITNNIDLSTKEHCLKVLNAYTGSIIAISHDEYFLENLNCTDHYTVTDQVLKRFA